MTFVLAWKLNNEIFCISDTATTGMKDDENQVSTFGEISHQISPETDVEENTMKIVPVSERTVIAFSGTVYYANQYIKYLRDKQSSTETIDSLLISAHDAIPVPLGHFLGLLIIHSDASQGLRLLSWSSKFPLDIKETQNAVSMGSLDSWFREIGFKHLEYLVLRANMTSVSAFHCMIVILQQLGISNLFMQQGVGGAFFGGRMDVSGFYWQDDITYILYAPRLLQDAKEHADAFLLGHEHTPKANVEIISCLVRDGAWTIYSPYVNGIKMITRDDVSPMSDDRWVEKWRPVLLDKRYIFDAKYFAFVSKSGNNVTIIKPDNPFDNKYFTVDVIDNESFGLTFKPLLFDALADVTVPSNRNETATSFNFLIA